jgi:glyoxylase-like metal-dependent hydrolase (beta-lactamase superfamily II)
MAMATKPPVPAMASWLLAALGLAVSWPAAGHDPTGPQTIEHHSVSRVTSRIYVVHGPQGFPNENNAGFMNNPGFVVGDNGAIVVDPGSSTRIGRELVNKIRSVTDKPIVAVFNTHVHGDHWLGNDGIRRVYPMVPIYAHRRTIERLAAGQADEFVATFMRLTKGATAGTRAVLPTVALSGGETLTIAGLQLRIHHPGKAHTDTDLMIEVVEEQAVFLGDIVDERRVPSVAMPQDAYFKGLIAAVRGALQLPAKTYIPGHGRSGDQKMVQEALNFQERLYGLVTKYFHQGMSDFEMMEKIEDELSAYRGWGNFNELGKIVNRIYLEVEAESF